jgi:hypothetical protein
LKVAREKLELFLRLLGEGRMDDMGQLREDDPILTGEFSRYLLRGGGMGR